MPLIRKDPAPARAEKAHDALARLATGTADERWAAARALAQNPAAVAALSQALMRESDARVREALFTSLVRIGTADSVAAILPHLRADDAGLRNGALDALRAMPELIADQLASLLGDSDPDVRILVSDLARGLPSAQATPLLCTRLETESDINVCAAIIDVLAEVGNPDAVPTLLRCAARFPDAAFHTYAIKVTVDRIGVAHDRG